MDNFVVFFGSFLVIFLILKNIYANKNITKKISTNDNKEYFVRDLENSQQAAEKLSVINGKIQKLIDSLDVNEREGIDRLKKKI